MRRERVLVGLSAPAGAIGHDQMPRLDLRLVRHQLVVPGEALAKRGAELNAMVKTNRWGDRFKTLPIDLINKTLLIVGFGRIGTRVAKRCLAMEMSFGQRSMRSRSFKSALPRHRRQCG